MVSPTPSLPLPPRIFLPEFFNFLAHLLGLGPGPDHLGLDGTLVGAAADLEVAGVAPFRAPGVCGELYIGDDISIKISNIKLNIINVCNLIDAGI